MRYIIAFEIVQTIAIKMSLGAVLADVRVPDEGWKCFFV